MILNIDFPQPLKDAIQGLYTVFDGAGFPSSRFGECSWLMPEQVRVLKSKPLKALTVEELALYANYAWHCGTEADFRYFLPRISELFAQGAYDIFWSPHEFTLSVSFIGFTALEKASFDVFLMEFWKMCLNSFPAPYYPDEILCGLAQIYENLQPFLDLWKDDRVSIESGKNLAHLASSATYNPNWGDYPRQRQQLISWLLDQATIDLLESYLERYIETPFAEEFLEAVHDIQKWRDAFDSPEIT